MGRNDSKHLLCYKSVIEYAMRSASGQRERPMDLSVFKRRHGGSWRASKLAALVCFLATGAILAAALLQQHDFNGEIASTARQLF